MRLAIGITTAPRPHETLTASYRSLRAAGFAERVTVFADGPVAPLDGADIRQNAPALGGLRNWCHALEELVLDEDAGGVLLLEDDILWACGARLALDRDLGRMAALPNIGYLSLYCANKVARHIEQRLRLRRLPAGWHESLLGWESWGSQALLLPRASAVELLRSTEFCCYRDHYVKNRNRDAVVSKSLRALGYKLLFRIPPLVSHELGEANSSLGPKPIQPSLRSDYWTGKP